MDVIDKENEMHSLEMANEDIIGYYTTALDALSDIGRANLASGKIGKALHVVRMALPLLEASEVKPESSLQIHLLYGQALLFDYVLTRGGGHPDLLFSTLLKAKQIAEASSTKPGLADALSLLGQAHYFTAVMGGAIIDHPQSGKYDEALSYQQQALDLREALPDTRGMSEALFQIGAIYERWQLIERSEEYYTQARQIAEQYAHLFEKAEPARHFAFHALMKGNLDEALRLACRLWSCVRQPDLSHISRLIIFCSEISIRPEEIRRTLNFRSKRRLCWPQR